METTRDSGQDNTKDGIDVRVLGVCAGSSLEELNCALIRYRQHTSDAPLRMDVITVCILALVGFESMY